MAGEVWLLGSNGAAAGAWKAQQEGSGAEDHAEIYSRGV